ncbi:MAG: hypothetical protein AAF244_04180 [Pseudomonadota bacterium]
MTNARKQHEIENANPKNLVVKGRQFFAQGQIEHGQLAFAKAVIEEPENAAAKSFFTLAVSAHYPLNQYSPDIEQAINLCLQDRRNQAIS